MHSNEFTKTNLANLLKKRLHTNLNHIGELSGELKNNRQFGLINDSRKALGDQIRCVRDVNAF